MSFGLFIICTSASITRQDKTNFISQKDHKATYIAIKEYSTLWYINRTTAIRCTKLKSPAVADNPRDGGAVAVPRRSFSLQSAQSNLDTNT